MGILSTPVAYSAGSFDTFVAKVDTLIVNPLIYLLFALALVYFLWGMAEFLMGGDNEEKRSVGKSHMLWGIVGLAIMMGVWTILGVVLNTLNIQGIDPENSKVELPPISQ